ncbi:hypothetical protein BJ508DRAFT_381083 [Ascobolus immersus RN42]|uniref:Uncharacterized protein n=1 Tax=Ascobolus immersus RN42 TaxID=1160509 RepID=A0A3N4HHA2_ASCIM|nr:hypothetical protein BJ508DRAFT_381083 [Ascobolus immersus RN42]
MMSTSLAASARRFDDLAISPFTGTTTPQSSQTNTPLLHHQGATSRDNSRQINGVIHGAVNSGTCQHIHIYATQVNFNESFTNVTQLPQSPTSTPKHQVVADDRQEATSRTATQQTTSTLRSQSSELSRSTTTDNGNPNTTDNNLPISHNTFKSTCQCVTSYSTDSCTYAYARPTAAKVRRQLEAIGVDGVVDTLNIIVDKLEPLTNPDHLLNLALNPRHVILELLAHGGLAQWLPLIPLRLWLRTANSILKKADGCISWKRGIELEFVYISQVLQLIREFTTKSGSKTLSLDYWPRSDASQNENAHEKFNRLSARLGALKTQINHQHCYNYSKIIEAFLPQGSEYAERILKEHPKDIAALLRALHPEELEGSERKHLQAAGSDLVSFTRTRAFFGSVSSTAGDIVYVNVVDGHRNIDASIAARQSLAVGSIRSACCLCRGGRYRFLRRDSSAFSTSSESATDSTSDWTQGIV